MEKWIVREITAGLKRLYSLRLNGTPAADRIQYTIEEWSRSAQRKLGNSIESIDTPRIVAAFDWMVDNCQYWPPPMMLYEHMPRRPERKALREPISDEEYTEGLRRLREITAILN